MIVVRVRPSVIAVACALDRFAHLVESCPFPKEDQIAA